MDLPKQNKGREGLRGRWQESPGLYNLSPVALEQPSQARARRPPLMLLFDSDPCVAVQGLNKGTSRQCMFS